MSDNTPIIARTAMLASLHARQWSGRKFDRDASDDFNKSKGADKDAARVNKLLVSKEALKPVQQLVTQCRQEFYRVTLPWGDDGDRILPAAAYPDFAQFMDQKQDEFDRLVDTFVEDYRKEVREAAHRMGDLFNIGDYPKPSEIRNRFSMSFSVRPIPTQDDFRVNLSSDVEDAIRQQVQSDLETLTQTAMQHVWQRVGTMIEDVRDRLADPNARFKRNLLDNLVEMVEDLERLNVTGDPNLTALRNEAFKSLTLLRDPDALRKDEAVRADAAKDMQKLADQFGNLWG